TRAEPAATRSAIPPISANGPRRRSSKLVLVMVRWGITLGLLCSQSAAGDGSRAWVLSPATGRDDLSGNEEACGDDGDEEDQVLRVDHSARHVLEALGDADVLRNLSRNAGELS